MTVSWEEELTKRQGFNRRAGSPVALIGFTLGLLAMSTGAFLYYWLFAAIAPIALTAVFAIASLFAGKHLGAHRPSRRRGAGRDGIRPRLRGRRRHRAGELSH